MHLDHKKMVFDSFSNCKMLAEKSEIFFFFKISKAGQRGHELQQS